VLSQALRANKLAIEAWARAARPGARGVFKFMSSSEVGYGVVRATGKLANMRAVQIVLKMEQCNGKLSIS
jgi:hypothetical protein